MGRLWRTGLADGYLAAMSVIALFFMIGAAAALWGFRDGNWFTILFAAGLLSQIATVYQAMNHNKE